VADKSLRALCNLLLCFALTVHELYGLRELHSNRNYSHPHLSHQRFILHASPQNFIPIHTHHCKKLLPPAFRPCWYRYCKTRIVRVPFISRISRPLRVRENNGREYVYFISNLLV